MVWSNVRDTAAARAFARRFGLRVPGESNEDYVRRVNGKLGAGDVQPVLPALVELYDRVAALEARVQELARPSRDPRGEPEA
jgi:hypothetical protein